MWLLFQLFASTARSTSNSAFETSKMNSLPGNKISPTSPVLLKMNFLFPRWDWFVFHAYPIHPHHFSLGFFYILGWFHTLLPWNPSNQGSHRHSDGEFSGFCDRTASVQSPSAGFLPKKMRKSTTIFSRERTKPCYIFERVPFFNTKVSLKKRLFISGRRHVIGYVQQQWY